MNGNQRVYDLVQRLLAARGWRQADLLARSGISDTTLNRLGEGAGGRTDTLRKLDEAFEVEPGTFARVKGGSLAPDDAYRLATSSRQTTSPAADPSIEFRLRAIERAIIEIDRRLDAWGFPPADDVPDDA